MRELSIKQLPLNSNSGDTIPVLTRTGRYGILRAMARLARVVVRDELSDPDYPASATPLR